MEPERVLAIVTAVAAVRKRMALAARAAGRDPASVRLMAVGKGVAPADLAAAAAGGVDLIGMNYTQEGIAAMESLGALATTDGRVVEWRLIGHLQQNKAKAAVTRFAGVDSVDSGALAHRLDRLAAAAGRRLPVLIEVNMGEESSKFGVSPPQATALAQACAGLEHVDLRGFMTIPPPRWEIEARRGDFRHLKSLAAAARSATGLPLPDLSMGMSQDYHLAVEEGATIVRIGTAIFGA